MEYYEYALKLAKICVDLCPESFEAWMLLAECYYFMRKIRMSLIAMDIAPLYPDIEYISDIPSSQDYDISKPKLRKSTDTHSYLMLEPKLIDFRRVGEDPHA